MTIRHQMRYESTIAQSGVFIPRVRRFKSEAQTRDNVLTNKKNTHRLSNTHDI